MARLAATTYRECVEFLGDRESRKIGNNTVIRMNQGDVFVELHGHPIVLLTDTHEVLIRFAGYPTVTTRERINQFLPSGVRVHQHKHQQFINDRPVIDLFAWHWAAETE